MRLLVITIQIKVREASDFLLKIDWLSNMMAHVACTLGVRSITSNLCLTTLRSFNIACLMDVYGQRWILAIAGSNVARSLVSQFESRISSCSLRGTILYLFLRDLTLLHTDEATSTFVKSCLDLPVWYHLDCLRGRCLIHQSRLFLQTM